MADSPVKTQIMVALGMALSAITELKTVNRFRGKPVDLDVIPLPALFFFDDGEIRKRNNLLQLGVIDLVLSVYMAIPDSDSGDQKFSDDADIIQAKVHNVLFGTTCLPGLGVIMLEEVQIDKGYPNGEFGVLVMNYKLTYAHGYGNAYIKDAT